MLIEWFLYVRFVYGYNFNRQNKIVCFRPIECHGYNWTQSLDSLLQICNFILWTLSTWCWTEMRWNFNPWSCGNWIIQFGETHNSRKRERETKVNEPKWTLYKFSGGEFFPLTGKWLTSRALVIWLTGTLKKNCIHVIRRRRRRLCQWENRNVVNGHAHEKFRYEHENQRRKITLTQRYCTNEKRK